MSAEYTKWRTEIDLKLQDMETRMKAMSTDNQLLKNIVNGMELSVKALADAQEGIANELTNLTEGGKTSVGFDGLITAITGITAAISTISLGTPPSDNAFAKKPKKESKDPTPVDIDVSDIDWRIKGNEPAEPRDNFAYAFAFEQGSKTMKDEIKEAYQLCKQFGVIRTQDGYDIKIGGNEGNLLNRTPSKRK